MTEPPKSAFDLAMEKLRKQDAESGVEATPLTDQQRQAMADVRQTCTARVAERKIMHQSETAGVPETPEQHEQLRRDLDRFERERDEKIKRIRDAG